MKSSSISSASSFSPSIKAELKEHFQVFDKNNEGQIEIKEFGTLMRSLGHDVSHEKAKKIVATMKLKDNSFINFAEFQNYIYELSRNKQIQAQMKQAFKTIDLNDDGYITADDLNEFLKKIGHKLNSQEIAEMIKDADVDGDDGINYEEFVRIILTR